MSKKQTESPPSAAPLNEDWLSVILAFLLILLAALGIFGERGVHLVF